MPKKNNFMKKLVLFLLILCFPVFAFAQTKGETMTVKVYFSDSRDNPNFEDCAKVRAVTREVPKTKAVARAALEELFKGTTEREDADGLSSFFSAETKDLLIGVKIKRGAAFVNLKDEVIQKLGNATTSCGSAGFHATIEQTLKQFPSVKKIFFAIEGKPADYYDWMQSDCPKELKNCSGRDF